jgi:hypothetical protein
MYPEKGEVIAFVGVGNGDLKSTRASVAIAVDSLKKVNKDQQLNFEIFSNSNIKRN